MTCLSVHLHMYMYIHALQVPYYRQDAIEFEVHPVEIMFAVQNDTVYIEVCCVSITLSNLVPKS